MSNKLFFVHKFDTNLKFNIKISKKDLNYQFKKFKTAIITI